MRSSRRCSLRSTSTRRKQPAETIRPNGGFPPKKARTGMESRRNGYAKRAQSVTPALHGRASRQRQPWSAYGEGHRSGSADAAGAPALAPASSLPCPVMSAAPVLASMPTRTVGRRSAESASPSPARSAGSTLRSAGERKASSPSSYSRAVREPPTNEAVAATDALRRTVTTNADRWRKQPLERS